MCNQNNIEEKKIKIEEERLLLEKEKNEREKRFFTKHFGSILAGAAILVSGLQGWIAYNNYSFQTESHEEIQAWETDKFTNQLDQRTKELTLQRNVDYATLVMSNLTRINSSVPVSETLTLLIKLTEDISSDGTNSLLSFLDELDFTKQTN